jgi:2,3-dihydroxybiphenyl 1,2-dioxygenase
MDDRHHRIALRVADTDALGYLGWEVYSPNDFNATVDALSANGTEVVEGTQAECSVRRVERMAHFRDPNGLRHEFAYGMLEDYRSFVPGRKHGGFLTGERGLGHAVLAVPDGKSMDDFLVQTLNFKVSDIVHSPYGVARFYHLNSRHHSLATLEMPGMVGLDHVMVEAREMADVGIANDRVQDRMDSTGDVSLRLSLGQHSTDRMTSVYVITPSGFCLEYGWGGRDIDESAWTVVSTSAHEVWGHKMVGTPLPPTIRRLESASPV